MIDEGHLGPPLRVVRLRVAAALIVPAGLFWALLTLQYASWPRPGMFEDLVGLALLLLGALVLTIVWFIGVIFDAASASSETRCTQPVTRVLKWLPWPMIGVIVWVIWAQQIPVKARMQKVGSQMLALAPPTDGTVTPVTTAPPGFQVMSVTRKGNWVRFATRLGRDQEGGLLFGPEDSTSPPASFEDGLGTQFNPIGNGWWTYTTWH